MQEPNNTLVLGFKILPKIIMFEINAIENTLVDLAARTTQLRGYL